MPQRRLHETHVRRPLPGRGFKDRPRPARIAAGQEQVWRAKWPIRHAAGWLGCGPTVVRLGQSGDPKVSDAKRYDTVTFGRVLSDDLKVMDAAAVALCRDNNIPIVVFNIRQPGNLAEVIEGRGTATIVQTGE